MNNLNGQKHVRGAFRSFEGHSRPQDDVGKWEYVRSFFRRALPYMFRSTLLMLALAVTAPASTQTDSSEPVTVTVLLGKPVNTFRPDEALGAGVDGMEHGDVEKVYTPANIAAIRSAGFTPLTYRLRTELAVEAWHWNPRGTFSEAAKKQGYWTSDATPAAPILVSNGYTLPRRGSSGDQANNRGYSRIDDGDPNSYWKSNPYLDRRFTGEHNRRHPQWMLVDFGRREPVAVVRIRWGEPYARRYQVEYWRGTDPSDPQELPDNSGWVAFPMGKITNRYGGDDLRRIARKPIEARWIRVLMTESSGTAPAGADDVRDGLGYAVREIYIGNLGANGRFRDLIHHAPNARQQTHLYASSTDPWHTVTDLDPNVEQPGFDRIYRSGLSSGLPVLMPVGLLYDTPENAAAEVRWLKARGYPLKQIEAGEEPDGQYMMPEDYGALFIQWADAIHAVDPHLELGGPGFQTVLDGWQCWCNARGNTSWISRFLAYLKRRNHLQDFRFFSFEWYPFDQIGRPTGPQLAEAPALLDSVVSRLQREGLSRTIPWIITEYGYSSFAGEAEVDLPGALLNAEIVAQFLTLGGKAAYVYGCEPNVLMREQRRYGTWGNLALFLSDADRKIRCPLPVYYGAALLTQHWAQPGHGTHEIFHAKSNFENEKGQPLITAYAARRPDGRLAVLLINKDPRRGHRTRVQFENATTASNSMANAEMWQYGPKQYVWYVAGQNGHPTRNHPPAYWPVFDGTKPITLPPYSLTVLRSQ